MQSVTLQVPLLEIVGLEFEELEYEPNNCTIKFCDSRPKEFSYYGAILQDYVLSDPSSALNASANIIALEYYEEGKGRVQDTDPRACMLLNQSSEISQTWSTWGMFPSLTII